MPERRVGANGGRHPRKGYR